MNPLTADTPAPIAGRTTGDIAARYRDYVAGMSCAQRGKRLRILGLERFLERFGDDLDRWMQRPTAARLDDVRRCDAWPFLSWCFATGRVRPDVELLAARSKGAHLTTWCSFHHHDADRAVAAGQALGWSHSPPTRRRRPPAPPQDHRSERRQPAALLTPPPRAG